VSRARYILVGLTLSWSTLLQAADATPPRDDQAAGDSAAALANPLAAQSLEGLSGTRERPLFSPTRRPPPPPPTPTALAPAPPPPPPAPPSVTLVGVVMDGMEARAVVRSGTTDPALRVQIGDKISGWTVSQIESRKLVLSLDGRLATFTMFSSDGSVPNDPATPAMQRDDSTQEPAPSTRKRRRRGQH